MSHINAANIIFDPVDGPVFAWVCFTISMDGRDLCICSPSLSNESSDSELRKWNEFLLCFVLHFQFQKTFILEEPWNLESLFHRKLSLFKGLLFRKAKEMYLHVCLFQSALHISYISQTQSLLRCQDSGLSITICLGWNNCQGGCDECSPSKWRPHTEAPGHRKNWPDSGDEVSLLTDVQSPTLFSQLKRSR